MSEMTSLKAVEEPMIIRLRRQALVVVTSTESKGIELRGSTYKERLVRQENRVFICTEEDFEISGSGKITLLNCFQNGNPRSRANDQVIREEEATKPIVPHTPRAKTIVLIAVLPPTVPTACRNISIKG